MAEYIDRNMIFSVWRSMPDPASADSLIAAIHQTPHADVAPVRHIAPIYCGPDEYYGRWIRCPICDFDLNTAKAAFCGGCGAKIDRGADNEV